MTLCWVARRWPQRLRTHLMICGVITGLRSKVSKFSKFPMYETGLGWNWVTCSFVCHGVPEIFGSIFYSDVIGQQRIQCHPNKHQSSSLEKSVSALGVSLQIVGSALYHQCSPVQVVLILGQQAFSVIPWDSFIFEGRIGKRQQFLHDRLCTISVKFYVILAI